VSLKNPLLLYHLKGGYVLASGTEIASYANESIVRATPTATDTRNGNCTAFSQQDAAFCLNSRLGADPFGAGN
jgi:hypothetical protein